LRPGIVLSTIVDAGSQGVVFKFMAGEDRRSILTGFTIKGGRDYTRGGEDLMCRFFSDHHEELHNGERLI